MRGLRVPPYAESASTGRSGRGVGVDAGWRAFAVSVAILFVAASAAVGREAVTLRTPSLTVILPPAKPPTQPLAATRGMASAHPKMSLGEALTANVRPSEPRQTHAAGGTQDIHLDPAALIDSTGSRYTSLEPSSCDSLNATAADEVRGRICPGIAGYALEVGPAGPRHLAVITPPGKRSDLDLAGYAGSIGRLAEWRAPGSQEPRALIVRVGIGKFGLGSLIVVKLDSSPCVVTVIPPGRRQNEKAREVADSKELVCAEPRRSLET